MKESPVPQKRPSDILREWVEYFVSGCINLFEKLVRNPLFWFFYLLLSVIGIGLLILSNPPPKILQVPSYHVTTFASAPPLSAYVGLIGGYDKLYTIRADGSHLTEIANFAPLRIVDAKLSPDGKFILVRVEDTIGNLPNALYVMSNEGKDRYLLTEMPSYGHQWVPDSKAVLYIAYDSKEEEFQQSLYYQSIDSNTPRKLADEVTTFVINNEGTRIIFTQGHLSGDDSIIYTMNIDGSNLTLITDVSRYYYLVQWYPDGEFFLVLEASDSRSALRYPMKWSVDGSSASLITPFPIQSGVSFSPDNHYVAYADTNKQIYIASIDSITPTLSLSSTIDNYTLSEVSSFKWSTYGQGLAFVGSRPWENPSINPDAQMGIFWFGDTKVGTYSVPTPAHSPIWLPGRRTVVYETQSFEGDLFYSNLQLFDLTSNTFSDLGRFRHFEWRITEPPP
jgi:hypothetical protein